MEIGVQTRVLWRKCDSGGRWLSLSKVSERTISLDGQERLCVCVHVQYICETDYVIDNGTWLTS